MIFHDGRSCRMAQVYTIKRRKILTIENFTKNRCESCINRLFSSGPAPCPQCRTTLRKAQFVIQTFEDLQVEKEVQIRKKVGKMYVTFCEILIFFWWETPLTILAFSFNKRLEDFKGDLRAYNDYLEEVEELSTYTWRLSMKFGN